MNETGTGAVLLKQGMPTLLHAAWDWMAEYDAAVAVSLSYRRAEVVFFQCSMAACGCPAILERGVSQVCISIKTEQVSLLYV